MQNCGGSMCNFSILNDIFFRIFFSSLSETLCFVLFFLFCLLNCCSEAIRHMMTSPWALCDKLFYVILKTRLVEKIISRKVKSQTNDITVRKRESYYWWMAAETNSLCKMISSISATFLHIVHMRKAMIRSSSLMHDFQNPHVIL